MSPPGSPGSRKGTPTPQLSRMSTPRKQSISSLRDKSPTISIQSLGHESQQRRDFLHHLTLWSLDHDASVHFHGKISLLPRRTRGSGRAEELDLGKAVTCVLTDTSYPDARQNIIIKLFPPPHSNDDTRRDSLSLSNVPSSTDKEIPPCPTGRYTLVVRSGSGWMSSRAFFSHIYFSHLPTPTQSQHRVNALLASRSVPAPADKDTVTIRPLFHPFLRLPSELQDLVLTTAAGLTRHYNLRSNDYTLSSSRPPIAPISLSTLFLISKSINTNLTPHIFLSTSFHFGLTGFTNFLWQSGPHNRAHVRRITFHFGKLALLHCIRWFAPDPVFELLEPPVKTQPPALQFFWRAQIRELVAELRLGELVVDIRGVDEGELAMVVAILRGGCGGVERVRFVDGDERVEVGNGRLRGLEGGRTWKDMCMAYYGAHRGHSFFLKDGLRNGGEEELGESMDGDRRFFDTPFDVMGDRDMFPRGKDERAREEEVEGEVLLESVL